MKSMLNGLHKAWFDLTLDERRALVILMALFLIGLIARYAVYRRVDDDVGARTVEIEFAGSKGR